MDFLTAVWDSLPRFLVAAKVTVALSAMAIVMAVPLGLMVTGLTMVRTTPLRWVANGYIGLIRGTPLITQIFILYFGLTTFFLLPRFWAAAIALTAHSSAYIAEIFRTGFQSVPRGLIEASRSLGMSKLKTFRRVNGPLAVRVAIPPLGNQFITVVKDSSLAAFVTVPGLFFVARAFTAETFEPLRYYIIVAIYYLIIVLILTFALNRLEHRLNAHRR